MLATASVRILCAMEGKLLMLKLKLIALLLCCGGFVYCLEEIRSDDVPIPERMTTLDVPKGVDMSRARAGPRGICDAIHRGATIADRAAQTAGPARRNAAPGKTGRQRRLDWRLLGLGRGSTGLHVGERLLACQAGVA